MKGVVLVGGLGTRLAPMTRVTNKHLLPVGRFPMVYYPLHALAEAGIEEVILITGGNSPAPSSSSYMTAASSGSGRFTTPISTPRGALPTRCASPKPSWPGRLSRHTRRQRY